MNKQLALVMGSTLAVALSSAASAGLTIYDNGDPDGTNGYSNIFDGGADLDRLVADDFILIGGATIVTNVEMNYIWDTIGSGGAVDFRVTFYADDAGGGPGSIVSDQISSDFTETLTGEILFDRPEVIFSVDIDPVGLAKDTTYWVSIQPNGLENGFQLTSHVPSVNGDQAYVLYPDLGHTDWVSTGAFFREPSDMSFRLQRFPAPSALALLGFAGLVLVPRRRRAKKKTPADEGRGWYG